mgnify:CR=1 FL=1
MESNIQNHDAGNAGLKALEAAKRKPPMTRDEMQSQALTIESLLDAAMAMANTGPGAINGMLAVIEDASERARALNGALDSMYETETPAPAKPTRDWHADYQAAEYQLGDMHNLVSALQVLCWQMCNHSFDGDKTLIELRDGLAGIGNAMEQVLKHGVTANQVQ